MLSRFVTIVLLLGPWVTGALHAQGIQGEGALSIEPVKDNLYLITGEGGNVAAYVTGEGVILVDNMFDRNHDGIVAAVATVTDQPIISFLHWTNVLDRTLELDFDTVIFGHGRISTKNDVRRFRADLNAMQDRIQGLIRMGASKEQVLAVFEDDYGWRSTGCPLSPPTPGCLQFQQMDALIEELTR